MSDDSTSAPIDVGSQVDTSAVKDLYRLRKEEEVLETRLEELEGRREEVSEQVYERVRQDYRSQLERLEEEARPLRQQARQEFAKLRELHAQLARGLENATLDQEELALRHSLGEFGDEEFEKRAEALARRVEEARERVSEAENLRESFLNAFRNEEELLAEESEPEAPAPTPEAPAAPPEPPPAAPPPAAEVGGTVILSREELMTAGGTVVLDRSGSTVEEGDAVPADGAGATTVLPPSFLVRETQGGSREEHRLLMGTTTIGRDPSSRIRLQSKQVSRHHAEVVLGPGGFLLRDLGSENGSLINGVRIEEDTLLESGDEIKLGDVELTFRQTGEGD